LKFLLDVNVGSTIASALIAAGHDVVRVSHVAPRDEDPDVLARAAGDRRILVTYDRDFGELLFTRRVDLPVAVIYIGYRSDDVDQVVARLMPLLDFDRLSGHMTVIDQRRDRRTPFPVRSIDNG
jgi:predicted nuclease of predicted toxin-antitoxin system